MYKNIIVKFYLRYLAIFLTVMGFLISFPHPVFATRTINSATLNGSSSVTVTPSSSITVIINVTTTAGGGGPNWQGTSWTVNGSTTCVDHSNHNATGSYSETFIITAPASNGTYNVDFIAYSNNACVLDPSSTYTLTNGITVATSTPTPAPTSTPTQTPTPLPPTSTPVPPTSTPVPVPTSTPIPGSTSTPTPIPESISTPTPTPTSLPSCGNGICQASLSETCSICSLDCGVCITPTQATISTPTPAPLILPSVAMDLIDPAPQTGKNVEVTGNFFQGTLAISRVEVTIDNGLTWFLAQTSGNSFAVTQENLEDGNYSVRARVIDLEGNIGQSNTQILLIDNLPPIVGGSAFAFGPQILSPDSEGFIRVSADTQITIALSTRGGVIKAEIKSDNKIFPLNIIPGTNIWVGNLSFKNSGTKILDVFAEDGVGKKTERSIGTFLVEPVGKITNQDESQVINNATVSVFFFDNNSQNWVLWDGISYGQSNPKKAENNGNYSFIVPAGRYFVQVDAPGRRRSQSEIFNFTSTSILNSNFKTSPLLNIFSNLLPPNTSTSLNKLTEKKPTQNMIGNSAPNFELVSSTGIVTSSSFLGKKTIFSFISTWAPESIAQAQILQKLKSQISSNQKILGIMLQETQSTTDTFLKRGGYNFPVLSDRDGYTGENYRVGVLPYHVFVDSKGIIREIYSGLLKESELLNKLNKLQ